LSGYPSQNSCRAGHARRGITKLDQTRLETSDGSAQKWQKQLTSVGHQCRDKRAQIPVQAGSESNSRAAHMAQCLSLQEPRLFEPIVTPLPQ